MVSFDQIVGFGSNFDEALIHARMGLNYHQIDFDRIKCKENQSNHYRVNVKDMKMWLSIIEKQNNVYKVGLSPVAPCDCVRPIPVKLYMI